MAEFRVDGLRELQTKLQRLGKAQGGKILRQSAVFAIGPTKRQAKRNAAALAGSRNHKTYRGRVVTPGFLSRQVAHKAKLSRDKRYVIVHVGPRAEAYYGNQFLERGFTHRARSGRTTRVAARPWLKPALDANRDQMVDRFKDKMARAIEKAVQ